MDYYDLQQTAAAVAIASLIYASYLRYSRSSVSDIPGPQSPSWVHGHQWHWKTQDAGVVEKHILENYGGVARWNGPLGEERLWIADPKAINHISWNAGTRYRKQESMREIIALFVDRGISWAEAPKEGHDPAFGLVEAKGLLPYFAQSATKLADKWHEAIADEGSGESLVVDTPRWLSKATLDAIGAGAFEYEFGALEGSDNPLARTYRNLASLLDSSHPPPKGRIFIQEVSRWLPPGFLTWLSERGQDPRQVIIRKNREEAHRVARTLIDLKREELKAGTSRRDVMSLLVKSSSALRPELRLNDDEIIAQVRTIMFAGHETTAKTLTFTLWELAKNRDIQDKLRAEVDEAWQRVKARGDRDFVVNDFDAMPYLVAVGKETLRVHSPVIDIPRAVWDDDVIPLSKPIVGVSGKVYNELAVPKGTLVVTSMLGYNLNPEVWGADSHEWRPERWFEATENPESLVGVYGNLATFSGGVRACLGWRFAVFEIHAFLVTLIRQFEFTLPDNAPGVRRWRSALLTPVVEGEEDKGVQLPLKITPIKNK